MSTENPSPMAAAVSRDRRRSMHRDGCVTLLRRYFNVCAEIGRMPSLLGRECFAARQSPRHRPMTFEDAVIFGIDVERCLNLLSEFERQLIARVVLQEHSEEDAARLLHCCRETISRRLPGVLDKLAGILVERRLLVFRRGQWRPESEVVSMEASAEEQECGALQQPATNGCACLPVEICCQAPAEGEINASV